MIDEIYQVVYCLEAKDPFGQGGWWENWYLLKCPLVGLSSLDEARELIKDWKSRLGGAFQPIIIGESKSDYERLGIDMLYGVTALDGLDVPEAEQPDFVLEEDLKMGEVSEG